MTVFESFELASFTSRKLRNFKMKLNDISGQIVDAALRVHTALGPGLLESAYQACLSHELRKRGLVVEENIQLGLR